MGEIAKEAGVGIATLFRYFSSKEEYVLEIGTLKWQQFFHSNSDQRPEVDGAPMTAAERYDFFLNSFIEMYREHRDLLRFNQFFNIFIQGEGHGAAQVQRYVKMIDAISDSFASRLGHLMSDGTMRQDISPQKIFSVSLHLMLAAATRFAVGLVYQPDDAMNPEEELLFLKQMLLLSYTQPH